MVIEGDRFVGEGVLIEVGCVDRDAAGAAPVDPEFVLDVGDDVVSVLEIEGAGDFDSLGGVAVQILQVEMAVVVAVVAFVNRHGVGGLRDRSVERGLRLEPRRSLFRQKGTE